MRRALWLSLVVAVASALPLAGQAPQTIFRTRIERVRVDATVVDRGRPLAGLTAADFEVKDNGTIVRDLEVATTQGSVGVAIALGLGFSARPEGQKQLVAACHALASALEPGDRAWLVTFGYRFALKAGPLSDAAEIQRLIAHIRPENGAAMWDAMFGAVSLAATHFGRSTVVVMSDGVDRGSWLREDRAVEVLRRSDVVVNGVRPSGVVYGINALEAAAKATGGVVFYAERRDGLERQFSEFLQQFRRGYVLSYTPPAGSEKGWHDISVRLKNRRGTVRARDGYYEPGR